MNREIFLIAGPNGAGKTTASMKILPWVLSCDEFVNADEIAKGISPFHPEEVAVAAGRIQLERINVLIEQGKTFSIETTLATRSYVNLINQVHEKGYIVKLLFYWLPSADVAIERVASRVAAGGHNIPEDTIRRRFILGLRYLFELYMPLVDTWQIFDNHSIPTQCVAEKTVSGDIVIYDQELFEAIKNYAK